MIVFVFIFFILLVVSIRKRVDDEDILSKKDTLTVNGIFVILIFLSHSIQYFEMSSSILNVLFRKFQNFHNQWIVTTFLTFSGYGVMYKMMHGGGEENNRYLKQFPINRILKILINFDIAIILYLVMNIVLGIKYTSWQIVGSFIGLTSVGNSNWYIFTILIMYIVTYLGAMFWKEDYQKIALTVSVFSILYIMIIQATRLPSRFCSTVCCYALGIWIVLYKNKLIKFLQKKIILKAIVLVIPILLTYKLRDNNYFMNFNSIFFVLFIICFLSQFKIKSRVLYFLGRHAFSIYILQRIPMIIISDLLVIEESRIYLVIMLEFVITVGIAVFFEKSIVIVDKMLFNQLIGKLKENNF